MNFYRTQFLTWLLIATTSFLLVPVLYLAGTREILDLEQKKNLVFNINTTESYANFLLYKSGISGNPKKVIVGRDGWLFLGNDFGKLVSYSRTANYNRQQVIDSATWFQQQQTRLSALGVEVTHLLPPNKLSIYPEYAPPWLLLPERNITDVFVESSKAMGLSLIDMRPELLAAKKTGAHLYYQTDSHWNHMAGVLTYQRIIQQLQQNRGLKIEPVSDIETHWIAEQTGGNSQMLKINGLLPQDFEKGVELSFSGHEGDICISALDEVTLQSKGNCDSQANTMRNLTHPLLITNKNALNDLSVVWYRDSFGTSISSLMQNTFKTIWELPFYFYYFTNVDCFIRDKQPDIVLFMSVERNLIDRVMSDFPGDTPKAIKKSCPESEPSARISYGTSPTTESSTE